ncbi:MAG: hypothetical protein ABJD07_12860 [Gemmatimonadaceae bacterium]
MADVNARTATSSPRFEKAWAALVYALGTLMLGYPALAGKFLVSPPSDQYIGGFPVRDFAAQSLKLGHGIPQWNPYLFGGLPYIGAMHGDIFYPTFLLRAILPTDVAMTWSFIIHVFLAGFFTFVFLRAYGFGFSGSLVGGLAYMMGGPVAGLVSPGHDGKLYISALYPLALFCLVRGLRDGKRWAFGALGLVLGLAVLSPHPQLLQYMLLSVGAFALYLAYLDPAGARVVTRDKTLRLLSSLGSVVLGFLIGAVQYVPVLEYVPWSPRSGGMKGGYEHATSYSLPPEEIINAYVPQFSGILDNYWGRNGIHYHSEYIGASVLVLAGLALGGALFAARRRFLWFWIGTLIVALLWAFGRYTPFFSLVYAIVPGTKFFRAPSTMMFIAAFAVAILAAAGTERLIAGDVGKRYLLAWGAGALVVVLFAVSGGFESMATGLAVPQLVDRVALNSPALLWGTLRSALFVALALAIAFAAMRRVLSPEMATWALVAVIALDLFSIERLYWRFSEPASVIYASDATLDYVRKQKEPGRVLALQLSDEYAYHDPSLFGDGPMIHGVRLVTGYHGNELGRYDELLGLDDGMKSIGDPRFWRLLNMKYLLTNAATLPIPSWQPMLKLVAGPVKDAAGTTVYLYESNLDSPLAWVTPVGIKAADDAVLATLRDARFDYTTIALFAPDAAVPAAANVTALPAPLAIRARTDLYAPGHMRFVLDQPAPAGAHLVVSENYYPGWTATADGQSAPIGRAELSLMAVALPAGARTVELAFDSPSYHRGKTITLLAIAASLLWMAAGAYLQRKAHG